jgi:hypothetical protein
MLAFAGMAQQTGPIPGMADAEFYTNLQPISNSPPADLWVYAGYYYEKQWPPYPYPSSYTLTNDFDIYVPLPAPAEDGWILEKEEDGSLTPVLEVTNLIDDETLGYFIEQSFTLTTNEIHSLIAGDWYLEVDFDGSNYIGNLVPSFYFANGPTVVMKFPPVKGMVNPNGYTVISPNNRTAKVVLDGSLCTDPYYLPMQFFWAGYTNWPLDSSTLAFTDTNMIATNILTIGLYTVRLQVDDSVVNGWPFYFYVNVITAGQAIDSFVSDLRASTIPSNKKQILISMLSTSVTLFNRGQMAQGCAKLEEYKKLVKAFHLDSAETAWLLQPAQDILDAFNNVERQQRGENIGPMYR